MQQLILDSLFGTDILSSIKLWLAEKNIQNNYRFYTTNDPNELDEIYRIRYQVYCEEYHYLDSGLYQNKRETDIYDPHSIHFVIRNKNNELAATARLIFNSEFGLPIEKHFDLNIQISNNNRDNIAEISRLIVAKKFRRKHLILVLIKGIYLLVKNKNISDIFSVLDNRLLPTLKQFGIPLNQVGKTSLYQGITTPFMMHVNEVEELLSEKNPAFFKFHSNGDINKKGDNYLFSPH